MSGASQGAVGSEHGRLLSVEEARARIDVLVGGPLGETDAIPVEQSLGRVAAEAVRAAVSLPPWDNSAMDGYAIRSADVGTATTASPVRLEVVGEVAAGAMATREVARGEALRIATGAPLPPGTDAVVEVESTRPITEAGDVGPPDRSAEGPVPASVLVERAVVAGGHVRRRGSDLEAGDRILDPGTTIRPAHVILLAGAGVASVAVHRRPRVGVLATGDEIRSPGEPLGPAGIPDANGPGLGALVAAAGAVPVNLGIARDRLADVRGRLGHAIEIGCDLVVVAGGVSVGPYDVVRGAFEELGRVDLWRVAVQPGKPFALGIAGRMPLFGLPGNPVSGFVTFELFVRPAILALAGASDRARDLDQAVLLDDARTSPGRRTYLRVTAERDSDGRVRRDAAGRVLVRLARGMAGQGSHVLSALAAAEALAIVPESVVEHHAGDPLDLLWLDPA